jgi:transposase
MFDVNDDAMGGFRRIEILTGPGRRRKWSAEEKARIVAETLEPGACVSQVARRWQVCPQQVFGWRSQARQPLAVMADRPTTPVANGFVPIVTTPRLPKATPGKVPVASFIEVKLAGAVVRVGAGADDGGQLTAVLRAIRASASET